MRPSPPTTTCTIAMLALISTLSAHAQPAKPQPPAPAPAFTKVPCTQLGVKDTTADIDCGHLSIPENHASATSITLTLPVVILRATGPTPADNPVVYLHGGPGIATLESTQAMIEARSVKALREKRDFVMFDQRGTGLTTPAICPDFDAALNKLGEQAPGPAIEVPRKREAAAACRQSLLKQGRDPTAYTSTAIADDIEALRNALGYRQWNVIATSYGSFPAFELARRHPATVRSLLLNSPFPPNSPNRAEQYSTTAEGLAALQARCNAHAPCRQAHPDMRKDAATAIARLNKTPLKTDKGQLDGDTFLGAMWNLLVRGKTAPFVPELLKRAAAGDDATVLSVAGPFAGPDTFGTFSHAQSWLVSCHDIYPRPSAPAVRAAMAALLQFAQDIDPEEQDLVCDALQPAHAPERFYNGAPLPVPALVYAGEYDPATPTSDAQATMSLLPNGTLASITGASHAPMSTDDCTLGIATRFIDNPQKAPDTTCLATRPAPTFPDQTAFNAFLKTLP